VGIGESATNAGSQDCPNAPYKRHHRVGSRCKKN
jgi:hypothetical protein